MRGTRVNVEALRKQLDAVQEGRYVTVALNTLLGGMRTSVIMDTHATNTGNIADLVVDMRPHPVYTGHTPHVNALLLPKPRGFTAWKGLRFPRY